MARSAVIPLFVVFVVALALAAAPKPAHAATVTWTGGDASSSLWTDPDNWSPAAPVAGDVLVFPQAASRKANTNDFPPNTTFAQIVLTGSGYELSGNAVQLTTSLRNEPGTGSNTVNLVIGGSSAIEQEDGTLVLTGANTFTNFAVVEAGTLVAADDDALGSTAGDTMVLAGGRLVVSGGVDLPETVDIEGDGPNDLGAIQSTSGSNRIAEVHLTGEAAIGVGTGTLTVGLLSAEPAGDELTLVGGGRLVVESSTFSEDVTVEHGNLTWNASASVDVVVEQGGWLRGTGSVGSIQVNGGLVWPGFGAAPAVLTSTGPSVFSSGEFRVDLDGPTAGAGYGRLATASLTLAPLVVILEVDLGFTPTPGQVFIIVANGGGAVQGTFRDLPEGATFVAGGWVFEISYKGGDGNDVTLKVLRQVRADLKLALSAQPSPVSAGGTLVYTATVTNDGPDAAAGVQLSMGTPVGTTFESATGPAGWTCFKPSTSVSVTCNGPTLAAGQTAVFTLTFRVNPGAAGPITGTASAFGDTSDPTSANNAQTVVTPVGPGGGGAFKLRLPGIAADSAGVSAG